MGQSIGNSFVPTSVAFLHSSKPVQNLVCRCWLVALLLAACFTGQAQTARGTGLPPSPRPFPIDFEANRGQASSEAMYLFHRDGMQAMFVRNGVDFLLTDPNYRDKGIHLRFLGADAQPDPLEPLAAHSNYFFGRDTSRWIHNVPLYSKIEYNAIYRGISLDFYGNAQELEHDFRVEPGADPSQIAFQLTGASRVRLSRAGDVEIKSAHGALTLRKPIAYQTLNGERRNVDSKFLLSPDGTVRFAIGKYDTLSPLVIDPVFVFSTYLSGSGQSVPTGVTTDGSGNILVTGYTTDADFPTSDPAQPALACVSNAGTGGCQNAFISKFDPTGSTLIYSTYLGGSNQDRADAIGVDSAGDAIIAGYTSSPNFPHAGSVVGPSCTATNECYFLASLSPDGSKLNYSGAIGPANPGSTGQTDGDVVSLAVDGTGNAYVSGVTWGSGFVVTPGTLASSFAGYPYAEMFVLKVDQTGTLIYSTPVPGNAANNPATSNNAFTPGTMTVDSSGDVTVVGTAGLGLPTTTGVVAQQFPNASVNVEDPTAGFVLQLSPTASAINFASYVPGTDGAAGFAVDSNGNLWIAGYTSETTLPVTASAYQKTPSKSTLGSISSGYILELSSGATSVLAATYLDGTGIGQTYESSSFSALAIDSRSNVFVGGYTSSPDFPLQDPFVTELEYPGWIWDMIVAEMSPDLSTLEFGSFMNSTDVSYGGSDFGGLTVDRSDNLIVAGSTFSSEFPTTGRSFEPQLPSTGSSTINQHTFVAKIDMSTPAPSVCLGTFAIGFGNVNANTSSSQTVNVTNCGNASLDITSVESSDPTVTAAASCNSVAPGSVCPVLLTFTPVSSKATSGIITLSDNAQTIPQTVSFTGQGIAPEIVANANPLSFGHVLVGAPAIDETLLISNGGQAALTVGTVTVTGAGYSLVSNGCTQSLPTSYYFCSIEISFAPVNSGTQTGSILVSSNDPATPQLTVTLTGVGDAIYAVPSISSISAPTVLINSGAVNLSISGANFYPQSVAQLNGVALSTTFQNNNSLQVTIPASSLTRLGEQQLVVVNPIPGGGTSPSTTITPYQTVLINPSALVSVPATGMIYAAIPSGALQNPNTVIPVDPTTGAPGTPIPVMTDPQFLSASDDGSYLYVAAGYNGTSAFTVDRINLTSGVVDRTFPFPPNPDCSTCSLLPATDLKAVPGQPTEVLLAQGDVLALYNDNGLVNYVPSGPNNYAEPQFDSLAILPNSLTVYALPFTIFQNPFFNEAQITSSGLTYTTITGTNYGQPNNGNQVITDGALLYTNLGQVWNPTTQTQVGSIAIDQNESPAITLDTSAGELYAVGSTSYTYSSEILLAAYGLSSQKLTGVVEFPQIYWPNTSSLVRWGTDGLAFIQAGVGQTDQELYLLRSSIVTPQTGNPTPTLTSISPTSVNAGGAAFALTVNGTGFLSSSVVEWNGTPLSTAYVSAQQLTASVPASDLASAGSAQVDVFNAAPGGGRSASAAFIINASAAPSFALSASPASLSVAQNGSGTSTITVSEVGGFSGTVTLAATGLPSGVTASFTAGTAAGTQLLTLSASSTTSLGGPVMVTVTGTSGALSATTAVSLTVTAGPTFGPSGVSGSDGAISVNPGATTGNTSSISVVGMNGYSGTVNLSCSISPTAANDPPTCSLSPASVALSGSTPQTSTLTVTTTAATTGKNQIKKLFWPSAGGTALALLLLIGVPRRRRNWLAIVGLAVLFASISAIGCGGGGGAGGGGGGNSGTSAGTYTVTVTGTSTGSSSSITATVGTVTLTVN